MSARVTKEFVSFAKSVCLKNFFLNINKGFLSQINFYKKKTFFFLEIPPDPFGETTSRSKIQRGRDSHCNPRAGRGIWTEKEAAPSIPKFNGDGKDGQPVSSSGTRSGPEPPGPQGTTGSPGAPGVPGKDGRPGSPGETSNAQWVMTFFLMSILFHDLGAPGQPGNLGKHGLSGDPGAPGSPGPTGPQEPVGSPGAPGQPGKDGFPGSPGFLNKDELRERAQEQCFPFLDENKMK